LSYKRRPIYEFDNQDSTGMSKVPHGSKIVIKDYHGKSMEFTKEDPAGVITDPNMTVEAIVTDSTTPTGNTQSYTAAEIDNRIQAALPFSGYTDKKDAEDNFIFQTSSDYTYKVGDKNRFIKFGPEIIDTGGNQVADFSNSVDGTNCVPTVTVVGFDPISTGSITGNHVAKDTQIGDILDNIPAQTANTRIKCRVKPTTDGIKVEILDKSDSDAVVRTQTVDGTDAETLTFTLPANDDGYKVKATKITNDGVDDGDDDTEDASEDIQVVAEVSTGLVVDSAVNKGDYVVVDKEELVTNGTFDFDLNGWESVSEGIIAYDDGRLKCSLESGDVVGGAKQEIATVANLRYELTLNVVGGTSKARFVIGTDSDDNGHYDSGQNIVDGTHTAVFTANDEPTIIAVHVHSSDDTDVAYYDNISVQLANDKFKAIENTNAGDSLDSSKFKPVDYISNQALAYHRYNPLTKVYDGIVTEVMMNDAWAKDSTTKIMTNNGFSSLGGGLFSKGAYLCVPVGYWQTLNKGAFHEIINRFGTRYTMNDAMNNMGAWSNSNYHQSLSIAETFIYAYTGGGNIAGNHLDHVKRRPDLKVFDIVYPSQFIDLRYSAKAISYYDIASKEFNDGVSGKGGVCDTVGMVESRNLILVDTWNSTTGSLNTDKALSFATKINFPTDTNNTSIYTYCAIQSNEGFITKCTYKNENEDTIFVDSSSHTWTEGEEYIVAFTKQLPITQSKEQFVTDIIGSSENYPTIMKDMLARGETIVGLNPLLVGQDGSDYIPDGDTHSFIVSAKKISNSMRIYYDPDNGYEAGSNDYIDSVTNASNTTPPADNCLFLPYTASIPVATIQDPKKVEYVLEKYIAQNDASIYKGANITGLIGIPTGTSDSMESGYLDGCEAIIPEFEIKIGGTYYLYPGIVFKVSDNINNTVTGINMNGMTVQYIGGSTVASWKIGATSLDGYIVDITLSLLLATPSHNTISISNTGDKASKAFLTIASDEDNELYAQWMVEEVKGDGDTGDFSQLTNGTKEDFNGNVCRTVVASRPLGLFKENK